MAVTTCKICDKSEDNPVIIAREMMFGKRDEFEYFQCLHCGCLQISEIPSNLAQYYKSEYYSLDKRKFRWNRLVQLREALNRYKLEGLFGEGGFLSRLLLKILGSPKVEYWVKPECYKPGYKVLDVGCGSGRSLLRLKKSGLSNLTGVDPFISEDIHYPNGVNVYKKGLEDLDEQFDFITLHHSLEHMPNQQEIINTLFQRLRPNRCALIRIPLADSYAWKHYGINWVQLDAPRHLFLHSVKSIESMAQKAGFEIRDIIFDSTEFQFLGSEQYVQDIPLMDERSYKKTSSGSVFSEKDFSRFKEKSIELNNSGEGDQACFYLWKN